MTDIVCPNCHSVTLPLSACLVCNSSLGDLLDDLNPAPARTAKSASGYWSKTVGSLTEFLAFARSALIQLLPSSKRGRPMRVPVDAHLIRRYWRTERYGIRQLPTASTKADQIAVVAKVRDVDEFEKHVKQHKGRVVTKITGKADDRAALAFRVPGPDGDSPGDNQTAIVTARIGDSGKEIERLRNLDCVVSLKAARRVRPFMERTRREALLCDEWLPEWLPTDDDGRGGKDVIIGIIDFGLDFAHRNFQYVDEDENVRTRVLALWDQKACAGKGRSPEKFGYGRLYEQADIDAALRQADPYKALGYDVPKNGPSGTGAHGTHVTDVAAGNGLGSSCPGVASQADIVFVDVATADTPTQGPQSFGSTFGDSVQLLEAIDFIFDYAKKKNRPCVLNISIGTNGGPHDGTTLVEQAIDRLVTQEPNRAVVIAAGNSFGKRLHATGRVPEGGCVDLKWHIPRFDATSNEVEIWYAGEDRFILELLDPRGKRVAWVRPKEAWGKPRGCREVMTVVNRLHDANNQDNTINVFFERGIPAGDWTLRLHGATVGDGRFHAWIERDEQGQSRFIKSIDPSYEVSDQCTLNSIACGRETIVVGSYNAYEADLPLSDTSSSGPTRDQDKRPAQQQQPTVIAPGEHVLAAQSKTRVLRHRQSGTSLAAPVVAGIVALMLAKAQAYHLRLKTGEIRKILIRTAHRDSSDGSGWDSGVGFGRVCGTLAVVDVGVDLDAETLDKHGRRVQGECKTQKLAYYV